MFRRYNETVRGVRMSIRTRNTKKQILPLLPLRGLTVFPRMTLPFDVGRPKSIRALEEAMVNNQLIFLVTQKDAKDDSPGGDDLYKVGTVSKVKQLLKLPGDTIRVLVEGLSRAEIKEILQVEPFFMAMVGVHDESTDTSSKDSLKVKALKRQVLSSFEEYAKLSSKVSPESIATTMSIDDVSRLADVIASNIILKVEQKQEILSEFNPVKRLEKLLRVLIEEIEILEIEKNINIKVRKQIDKMQREYYLREQMKVIQNELGDKDGITGEVEEYRKKIKELGMEKESETKVLKELDRLLKLPPSSAESGVIRTYLDWVVDLPWNNRTKEILDLQRCERILDEDHYGLEKVKERILEYLAVRKMKNSLKGPILCLVGPPGVGKTSIARSIARSLNRKYVRMSLGGVRDEAEIRGHRRTYVGSMPGRIISAMRQAGSKNPLLLLDEIDKMSSDFRGDPASALLEVLDGEQNFAFRDHYLEIPFDLSDVMFITTANTTDTIPRPLLDRMEVISISGYTEDEKTNIAIRHLLPKQIKAHGLQMSSIKFTEDAIKDIIVYYTREAGVRNLEREIANICRKAAKHLLSTGNKSFRVSPMRLEKLLGPKRYRFESISKKNEVGIATGLAWTPVGGDTLTIEVTILKGTGKLELTGHLGDVMKESARTAISYVRSRAGELNINEDFYKECDIHVHVPEGAIPKDGPSAGIALATAMVSALTGIPVKRDVAMTGEITLRGRVLPIGGLKEKSLAAHRAGVKTVLIPRDNEKDLSEIPDKIKKDMTFVPVDNMEKVLKHALVTYTVRRVADSDRKILFAQKHVVNELENTSIRVQQ